MPLITRRAAVGGGAPAGQQAWTTYTTGTSWTVPAGVTSVCILCVGSGGGTDDSDGSYATRGAGGGALSYSNNVSVTPGETLTIIVGRGLANNSGGDSAVRRSTTDLVRAKGGGRGMFASAGTGGAAASGVGNVKYSGGNGGAISGGSGGGGGGAAGYAGNGGNGNVTGNGFAAATDSGGAGGGSTQDGGGGVGILGIGATGASSSAGGNAGSGGSNGTAGDGTTKAGGAGGAYGGGAGGPSREANIGPGASGGVGAVRIIWGSGRSYPSNAADV